MQVDIVRFPETRVAVIEHDGDAAQEHQTVRKLVAFKLEHGLRDPERYRHYGLHFSDPARPQGYRVSFCLSIDALDGPLPSNESGIHEGVITACRCARARDVGSRNKNQAVPYLFESWLPTSGETPADGALIFHYVNVGPNVKPAEMITDVYLPLVDPKD